MIKSGQIFVHYGEKILSGFIPQKAIDSGQYLSLKFPEKLPEIKNISDSLEKALEMPVGSQKPLSLLVKECYKGGIFSIITDDHDRPNTHTKMLLPILLEILKQKHGIKIEKIKIILATGTHRSTTTDEIKGIVGEKVFPQLSIEKAEIGKIHCVIHKCREGNIKIGRVDNFEVGVDETVFNSDIIIPLTDIENHYFAGIAGGPKAFCPGVCDMETINNEHLRMFSQCGFAKNVDFGITFGNPVFDTKIKIVKEIIKALKKNGREVYGIAAILDTEDRLVHLSGGELFEMHRRACGILDNVWTVKIEKRADLIIQGAGHLGINLYQMGKSTHCAYHAIKRGGIILNMAPCKNGWGNEEFKMLMKMGMDELYKYKDRAEGIKKALAYVTEVVKKDYKIGKQKPVYLLQTLDLVGWGNLQLIQDCIPEYEYDMMPYKVIGNSTESVEKRLSNWIKYNLTGDRTIAVIDNPNYLIKPEND